MQAIPMSRDDVLAAAANHDAILLTSFDKLGADFIGALPPSIRIIATHSVGYDHLNIPLAKQRGIAVTNTPRRPHRCHGGYCPAPHPRRGARRFLG